MVTAIVNSNDSSKAIAIMAFEATAVIMAKFGSSCFVLFHHNVKTFYNDYYTTICPVSELGHALFWDSAHPVR